MKKILCLLLILFSATAYTLPFTIVPKAGTQLPASIATGSTVTAYYTISNNTASQRNHNFVKYLPPNVTQVTSGGTYSDTCGATFDLAPNGGSCTLQLTISGPVSSNDPDPQHHLFVCFPGGKTCAGTNYPLNVKSITDYAAWITNLSPSFKVAQGNAYLMVNTACPLFVSIFDSCFGQNPAAPYIIPQPPIEDSYVDPYYATALETPGPNGVTTDIVYRLSNNDALVTIVSYPPKAAFFGYQSYVFTREISNYVGITPPRARTLSPDPNRYEIFGSIGNDVNNVIVQNQCGDPWNSAIVVYITTSNINLANALMTNAKLQGINPNSIFVEPIGSNVITGNGAVADDLLTLFRYAMPESTTAANSWTDNLNKNVLVYKVTKPAVNVLRYGSVPYTAHTVNHAETTFSPSVTTALNQLANLLKTYLALKQPLTSVDYQPLMKTTADNAEGVPDAGLVGAYCLAYGTNCEGDDQDTSTYANLTLRFLGPEETAFIIGVNHNVPNFDNSRYISVGLYNAANSSGIASTSQTNPAAVGFDSGNLNGSVEAMLQALGISIPQENTELIANLPNLYMAGIARNINNPTIAAAKDYCINLEGNSLVPFDYPISVTERSYIVPGTTTGGNVNYMLYPIVIAATPDFEP